MKKKPSSILENRPLPEAFEESRYVEWIAQYGWYVLIGSIGIFTILFLIYSTGNNTKAETDYFNAERAMITLQTNINTPTRDEAFRQIRHILKRRPELHAKYDAALAQILMAEGLTSEANPYALRTLERLSQDALPLYHTFAKTTLLINRGEHAEALNQAQELKRLMLEKASLFEQKVPAQPFGDTLFAFNQLRIASLHHALGQIEREQLAWEEWNKYASGKFDHSPENRINPRAFRQLAAAITEGTTTLNRYIKSRLAT